MKTIIRDTQIRQSNPPHPGEVLSGLWLEPLGLSVTEAAKALGVSRKTISKIVNGSGAVTPEMAIRLELVFGASAQSWLSHQAAHDLWHAERRRKTIAREVRPFELSAAA
jgi:addiction module HigA family antidote